MTRSGDAPMIAREHGLGVAVGALVVALVVGPTAPTEPGVGAVTVRPAVAQDTSPPLAASRSSPCGDEPTPDAPRPLPAENQPPASETSQAAAAVEQTEHGT